MNQQFNLIDEGWIPCIMGGDGPEVERRCELGVRDILLQAPDIQEVSDPSPLVTVALHRLLLAIIHRAIDGPVDMDNWARLWVQDHWDAALGAYVSEMRPRFNLFGDQHPFYQVASIGPEYGQPVAKLTHELASGNNVTLFDHTTRAQAPAFTPAQAARYLVAYQCYAVGGLVSFETGQDPKVYKSAPATPLVKGAVALARGKSLFETLMLNLVEYNVKVGAPFREQKSNDQPAWERDGETRVEERRPDGYLDYLTWQSRRIRLFPSYNEQGDIIVREVAIMKGYVLSGVERRDVETMVAFRKLRKQPLGQDPYVAIGFRPDKALWRDSQAIFQSVDDSVPSKTLHWLHDLEDAGLLQLEPIIPLDLLGMVTDQASVLLWRHEQLPLPLAYLDPVNENLKAALWKALDVAEKVGRVVRAVSEILAKFLLAPDQGARQAALDDKRKLADSFGMERAYWPRLDIPFKRLLQALPEDPTIHASGDLEYDNGLPEWVGEVRRAAYDVFDEVTSGMDESGRSLKAVALARRDLRIEVFKVVKAAGVTIDQRKGDAA